MAIEIERKFLVRDDGWRTGADAGTRYRQGYLTGMPGESGLRSSVRVRIAGDRAELNIKSAELGIRRLEYQYEIPVADAEEMLDRLCIGHTVEKVRHHVRIGRHMWEIDVFGGDNAGLVVAEIELAREDEPFERPDWLGEEVSDDPRYYNVYLAAHPYRTWQ